MITTVPGWDCGPNEGRGILLRRGSRYQTSQLEKTRQDWFQINKQGMGAAGRANTCIEENTHHVGPIRLP